MTGPPAALQRILSARSFSVTYDYRCPFARNAHEHVVAGLGAGAEWEVEFVPFSLGQAPVDEGEPAVWDDPAQASHLLAVEAGIVVRERHPEKFLDVHVALFAARHDQGRDLRERAVVHDVLSAVGVDADEIMAVVADGGPRQVFRKAHEAAVSEHHIFGVPTFVVGDRAVFVRLMTRPDGDGALATATVERVLDLVTGHPELNEFKHTSIDR